MITVLTKKSRSLFFPPFPTERHLLKYAEAYELPKNDENERKRAAKEDAGAPTSPPDDWARFILNFT